MSQAIGNCSLWLEPCPGQSTGVTRAPRGSPKGSSPDRGLGVEAGSHLEYQADPGLWTSHQSGQMGRWTIPRRGEDQFLCNPQLQQSVSATPSFIVRNCSTSGFKAKTILTQRENRIPLPCPFCSLLCSPLTPGMASASLFLREGWSWCSSCPTLRRHLSSPLPQHETVGYFILLGKKMPGLWINDNEPSPAVLPTEEDGLPGQPDRADLERKIQGQAGRPAEAARKDVFHMSQFNL